MTSKKNKSISRSSHFIIGILLLFIVIGCENKQPPTAAVAVKKQQPVVAQPVTQPQVADIVDEAPEQQGYIYDRRNRRDPFLPLILPRKVKPLDKTKPGTLESYELKEFTLTAIVKMGSQYYALLVTPDNRSFTVFKGNTIGLNKGTVKEITDSKAILVEYSEDYTGKQVPREIILEFHKGE